MGILAQSFEYNHMHGTYILIQRTFGIVKMHFHDVMLPMEMETCNGKSTIHTNMRNEQKL